MKHCAFQQVFAQRRWAVLPVITSSITQEAGSARVLTNPTFARDRETPWQLKRHLAGQNLRWSVWNTAGGGKDVSARLLSTIC